jgi:hypothetical protein
MKKESRISLVMTADVVGSTNMDAAALQVATEQTAAEIEAGLNGGKRLFEFFRGDSFQAVLPDAAEALRLALLWRSAMMHRLPGSDLRVAFGAGVITHRSATASHSAGPAFERSGMLLDALKAPDEARIAFATGDAALNDALETNCLLAETGIRRWTAAGAEAVYLQLLYGETQQQLAGRLGIAQPAVHKRLQAASYPAIRHWEQYYRNDVASRIEALPS